MQARNTKLLRTVALDRYTRPRRFTLSRDLGVLPVERCSVCADPSGSRDCAEWNLGHSFEGWLLVDQVGE